MDRAVPASQEPSARAVLAPDSRWRIVCGLFAAIALVLFAFNGIRYINETQEEMRLIPYLEYDQRLDFNYFYAAAEMAWHGDADLIYPKRGEWIYWPSDPYFRNPTTTEYDKAKAIVRGSYYAPPGDAFVQAPLSLLSFKTAYRVWSLLSIGALMAFLVLAYRAGKGIPELPFLIIGALAYKPVYETLIMAHFALFFTLAVAAAFLLLRAEKPVLAGLALSVLALKPQWAMLPAIFLLIRGEHKALATLAVAGATIFIVPFIAAGIGTLETYIRFVRDVAAMNLKEAPHMFSWNGFLFKLTGEAVNKPLYYGLVALSIVPVLVVWRSKDYYLGVAATVTAMLLVNNHSVWYDWSFMVVAALFLVLRSPQMQRGHRVEMWIVMLVSVVSAEQSMIALLHPDRHFIDWYRTAFYSITPVAFVTLLWMASIAIREGTLRDQPLIPRFSFPRS